MVWGEGSALICFSSSFSSFSKGKRKLKPFPSRTSSMRSLFWSISEKQFLLNTAHDQNQSYLVEKHQYGKTRVVYRKEAYQEASSACWPCSAGRDLWATHGPWAWKLAAGIARKEESGCRSPVDEPVLPHWPTQQWRPVLQTGLGMTSPEECPPQS